MRAVVGTGLRLKKERDGLDRWTMMAKHTRDINSRNVIFSTVIHSEPAWFAEPKLPPWSCGRCLHANDSPIYFDRSISRKTLSLSLSLCLCETVYACSGTLCNTVIFYSFFFFVLSLLFFFLAFRFGTMKRNGNIISYGSCLVFF